MSRTYRYNNKRNTRKTKYAKRTYKPRNNNPVITQVKNQPVQRRAIRYYGSSNSAFSFSTTDLLYTFVSTTNSSTVAASLFQSARLLSVGLTFLPDSGTDVKSISFEWKGLRSPNNKQVTSCMPGVLSKKRMYPPQDTFLSYWVSDGLTDDTMFEIDPNGTDLEFLLDLDIEYVIADGAGPAATLSVAATFTGVAAVVWASGITPDELNTVTLV